MVFSISATFVDPSSGFIVFVQVVVTFEQACPRQIILASWPPCYSATRTHTFAFLFPLSFLSAFVLSTVWPLQFPVSQLALCLAMLTDPAVSTSSPII